MTRTTNERPLPAARSSIRAFARASTSVVPATVVVEIANAVASGDITLPWYMHDEFAQLKVPPAKAMLFTTMTQVPLHDAVQSPLFTVETIVPFTPPRVPLPLSSPLVTVKPA